MLNDIFYLSETYVFVLCLIWNDLYNASVHRLQLILDEILILNKYSCLVRYVIHCVRHLNTFII